MYCSTRIDLVAQFKNIDLLNLIKTKPISTLKLQKKKKYIYIYNDNNNKGKLGSKLKDEIGLISFNLKFKLNLIVLRKKWA